MDKAEETGITVRYDEILQIAKPILFNTDMVRAILEGRKTVTRRVIKQKVEAILNSSYHKEHPEVVDEQIIQKLCAPPYKKGDFLYVRETWQHLYELDGNEQIIEDTGKYVYAASPKDVPQFTEWVRDDGTHTDVMPWRPSIHMPKEAARIFLRVTDMRVEQLQDMDIVDFYKEGAHIEECVGIDVCSKECKDCFGIMKNIWNSVIKKSDLDRYGWDANPWVWVIEFERVEAER